MSNSYYSGNFGDVKVSFRVNHLSFKPIGLMMRREISQNLVLNFIFPNLRSYEKPQKARHRHGVTANDTHDAFDSFFKNGRTISAAARGLNNGKGVDNKAIRNRFQALTENYKELLNPRFEATFYFLNEITKLEPNRKSERKCFKNLRPYLSIYAEMISESKELHRLAIDGIKLSTFMARAEKKQKQEAWTLEGAKLYSKRYFELYTKFISSLHCYVEKEYKDPNYFVRLIAVCTRNNYAFHNIALFLTLPTFSISCKIPLSKGFLKLQKTISLN